MNALPRVAGVAATLLAGAALVACGSSPTSVAAAGTAPGCPSGKATLAAHGHGSAQGPPDLLTVSLGVDTHGATATAALDDNSTKANALVAQLTRDGVAPKDLQTSGLSIQQTYTPPPKQVLTGYEVTNTVTAELHNLGGAGVLIDDAAHAVGDAVRVDQMFFSIEDDSALVGQARGAAVHQALAQAQAMATAAGARLGPLCSLTDEPGPELSYPQPFYGSTGGAAGNLAAVPTTPIEPGSQQVSADVTAVYELRQGG